MKDPMTFVSDKYPNGGLVVVHKECGHIASLDNRKRKPSGKCDDCWVCLICGVHLAGMRKTRSASYCISCVLKNEIDGRKTVQPRTEAEKARRKASRMNRRHRKRAMKRHTDITTRWLYRFKMRATNCALCNQDLGNLERHVDHITPLGAGGTHTQDNVRVLCSYCNLHRPKSGSDAVGQQLNIWMECL